MKTGKMFAAKFAKVAAENALKRDANKTTCIAIYQPTPPTNLSRFKSNQK